MQKRRTQEADLAISRRLRGCSLSVGILFALLLILPLSANTLAQESSGNVSLERAWGVGTQVGLPYGGLVSIRPWITPRIGLEAILFASGSAYSLEGTVTARILYRISDAYLVDFYAAPGATASLNGAAVRLSLLAGIEFGFRLAPALAWNIEFGFSVDLDGMLGMSIGTGLHYYFPRRVKAATSTDSVSSF